MSHVHNVFVLYVLNGVSRSVVTDNLYSFSNHLFIVLQVQNKVNMLMIKPCELSVPTHTSCVARLIGPTLCPLDTGEGFPTCQHVTSS